VGTAVALPRARDTANKVMRRMMRALGKRDSGFYVGDLVERCREEVNHGEDILDLYRCLEEYIRCRTLLNAGTYWLGYLSRCIYTWLQGALYSSHRSFKIAVSPRLHPFMEGSETAIS
jgi:hypothetical protein